VAILGFTGTVGDALDNALAESFSPAWKANYSTRTPGRTRNQPANAIFEWINAWDNPRRHSALGYLSPIQYEQVHHAPAQKHVNGQNVQAIADLDELVVDVGEPVPGARHDGAAFWLSGIAERWHDYYQPGGMGMTGDRGYIGCGIITRNASHPEVDCPTIRRRTTGRSTRSAPRWNAPSPI